MQLQYKKIKSDYPNHILFFRLGDFYEVFDEDAVTASKILGLTLTGRGKDEKRRPMAGIPHHALSNYLGKLVEAGHRVVIADQTEEATPGKLVERKVTKVITPGTLTDPKTLDTNKNNYIGFLHIRINKKNKIFYFAFSDITTGEFKVFETNNAQVLKNELDKINPSEIICSKGQLELVKMIFKRFLSESEIETYDVDTAEKIIKDQTSAFSIEIFGLSKSEIILPVAMLIDYLKSCQRQGIEHIRSIKIHNINDYMLLDFSTIKNLDLIQTNNFVDEKFSLFGVLNNCKTSMGSRKLRSWILRPLIDPKKIQERLDFVEYFFENPTQIENINEQLKNISDIERIVGRIGTNSTNPKELISLSESLNYSFEVLNELKEQIKKFNLEISDLDKQNIISTVEMISETINPETPISISDGNVIKTGFSKEVDELREIKTNSKQMLAEIQSRESQRTGITSLKISYNKVFGYYIEITHANKNKVPEDYIRKQTLANAERYITQELKDLEEKILSAEEKIFTLENQIFQELIQKLYNFLQSLVNLAEVVAQIDIYCNIASISRLYNYIKPKITSGDENILVNARHAVVERNVDSYSPNNTNFNKKELIHIITGPNMSGKSTYIKQVALCYLMAQIGCFVPADEMNFKPVDNIFTRAGASDNLSKGESTFMVEMIEAANILNNATSNSLIILDEIGRGTSTYDGVSIAWSIIEFLQSKIKARTLFATHYHELTKLESEGNSIVNYNVEVDESGSEVRFTHSIKKGFANKSYGVHVAKIAGLPQTIVNRAEEILNAFETEDVKQDVVERKSISDKNLNKNNDTKSKLPKRPSRISPDQLGFGL